MFLFNITCVFWFFLCFCQYSPSVCSIGAFSQSYWDYLFLTSHLKNVRLEMDTCKTSLIGCFFGELSIGVLLRTFCRSAFARQTFCWFRAKIRPGGIHCCVVGLLGLFQLKLLFNGKNFLTLFFHVNDEHYRSVRINFGGISLE